MRQRSGEVFAKAGAGSLGKGAGFLQFAPEVVRAVRQPEGFQLRRLAGSVLAHQDEVTQVGDQHQPVEAVVAAHLIARGSEPGIIIRRFHLNHAAFRQLTFAGSAPLHLLCGVEAEVRMPRALVGQFADAKHLGLERCADGVQ